MNVNGFTWLLLAFPIYLLAHGRLVQYVTLTGAKEGDTSTGKVSTGLNNNQAIV